MSKLTYEEELLLATLLDGSQPDHDRGPERVLVNSGLAQRIGIGRIEITSAGVNRLGDLAKARGEPDDLYSGNHGF